MEGNEDSDIMPEDSNITITGPKGTKVVFKDPKVQVLVAFVVGIFVGMGILTYLL